MPPSEKQANVSEGTSEVPHKGIGDERDNALTKNWNLQTQTHSESPQLLCSDIFSSHCCSSLEKEKLFEQENIVNPVSAKNHTKRKCKFCFKDKSRPFAN